MVCNQEEKLGGKPINLNATEFNTVINQVGLIDGGYSGSKYTWSNNRVGRARIMGRLDRVLYNSTWLSFCNTNVSHLHRTNSDHAPLLISCCKNTHESCRWLKNHGRVV